MKAEFENNDIFIKPFSETEYGVAFVNMVRKSCENCSFKGDNRVSDLTIGDFGESLRPIRLTIKRSFDNTC